MNNLSNHKNNLPISSLKDGKGLPMNQAEIITQALRRQSKENLPIRVEPVGNGYNGTGYILHVGHETYFLKMLDAQGFGHETPARRLTSLIEAAQQALGVVPAIQVCALLNDGRVLSGLEQMREAFAIFKLLPPGSQQLLPLLRDRQRRAKELEPYAIKMVDSLVRIHQDSRHAPADAAAAYDYSTQAVIHNPELMPGVRDFLRQHHPQLLSAKQYGQLMASMMEVREHLGTHPERLTKVHGDYWAANIFLTPSTESGKDQLISTDTRLTWGEPAADVGWMIGEWCQQALVRTGHFSGEFWQTAVMMVERYKKVSGDRLVEKYMALGYAFQAFAEATFTPDLHDEQRRDLIGAAQGGLLAALRSENFQVAHLDAYRQQGRQYLRL